MRKTLMTVLAIALVSLACTPEPLEFADWTIPVPEGTRVIEYAGVSPEERTERIELVEDLVIGGDTDDQKYSFYSLRSVAVDDAGRIYVADAGDHQVKVYDENGNHLMNLGREGQGPGEFSGPGWATIAGSLLVVADMRLSIWDLSGQHLGDKMFGINIPWSLAGRADGSVIARYPGITESGRQGGAVIVRWDSEAREQARYPSLPDAAPLFYPSREVRPRISLYVGSEMPSYAAGPEGPVYITPSVENQVFAFDGAGKMVWALRVAEPRRPLSRIEIDRAMETVHSRFPNAIESQIDWPEHQPALSHLLVDGHGHLYVFPYFVAGLEPDEYKVDVYSAEGERLFTGLMSSKVELWNQMLATHGDALYDVRNHKMNAEWQVARYRLVEPF